MEKTKKFLLISSQFLYCLLGLYSFTYCCYCSIKPTRFLFLKFSDFKNLFLEIDRSMLMFFVPLAFLGIIAVIILFIKYKENKPMTVSLIITTLIIFIVVYTFSIDDSTIFYSNIKYLYWLFCLLLSVNIIYSIQFFIKNRKMGKKDDGSVFYE